MEKIELQTNDSLIHIKNPFNEEIIDYLTTNTFIFNTGKIYGIVCEHGCGGDSISAIMSSYISCEATKIYIDGMEANLSDIKKIGWYLGNPIYSNGILKREKSVKKALEYAVTKNNRYKCLEDIIEDFHLKKDKLQYGISRYSGEKWRASLAVGYASNKKIYCFPWMNTFHLYNCLLNSAIYCFFKKLRDEGCIIILPTSRHENVAGFADEIIEITDVRFKSIISDNENFNKYY